MVFKYFMRKQDQEQQTKWHQMKRQLKDYTNTKVYARFKDNTRAADLAKIESLCSKN